MGRKKGTEGSSGRSMGRWGGRYSLRDWTCLRKRRYDTQEAAMKVAKKLGATVYRCPFDEYTVHYHLTHDKKGTTSV